METVIAFLRGNPLLLLFLVAGIGYPLGRIRILGARMGVAAVLFTGLAVGALDPDLKLPEIVYILGLVLFVYNIGLSSGTLFFSNFLRTGWRYNLLGLGGLLLAAGLTLAAARWLGFDPGQAAGMFTGSTTNTPALAGVLEYLNRSLPPDAAVQAQSAPVIAYSLTYPMGVMAMILTANALRRLWKVNFAEDAHRARNLVPGLEPLVSQTIRVQRSGDERVQALVRDHDWTLIIGRVRRGDDLWLANGSTVFQPGDLVNLVGTQSEIDRAAEFLGEIAPERLDADLNKYDKRRMIVSNAHAAGRRLAELELFTRYQATITRLRRGDVEFTPRGDTILYLGDQLMVVAPYEQYDSLSVLLGDSLRAASEVDILTFSLGIALGVLVGMIPFPLPGGVVIRLGTAGGPLLVALLLGAVGRLGPMVFTIPYSADQTLRQIGLVMFLAGVGTRSGYDFFITLTQGGGLSVFLCGMLITALVTVAVLAVGYRWMCIPFGVMLGVVAGMQTQTAVLSFGLEQAENELPNAGYALVYPLAMILKIILAQGIVILLSAS